MSSFLSAFTFSVAFCFKMLLYLSLLLLLKWLCFFYEFSVWENHANRNRHKTKTSAVWIILFIESFLVLSLKLILECVLKRWLMALNDFFITQFYSKLPLLLLALPSCQASTRNVSLPSQFFFTNSMSSWLSPFLGFYSSLGLLLTSKLFLMKLLSAGFA